MGCLPSCLVLYSVSPVPQGPSPQRSEGLLLLERAKSGASLCPLFIFLKMFYKQHLFILSHLKSIFRSKLSGRNYLLRPHATSIYLSNNLTRVLTFQELNDFQRYTRGHYAC